MANRYSDDEKPPDDLVRMASQEGFIDRAAYREWADRMPEGWREYRDTLSGEWQAMLVDANVPPPKEWTDAMIADGPGDSRILYIGTADDTYAVHIEGGNDVMQLLFWSDLYDYLEYDLEIDVEKDSYFSA